MNNIPMEQTPPYIGATHNHAYSPKEKKAKGKVQEFGGCKIAIPADDYFDHFFVKPKYISGAASNSTNSLPEKEAAVEQKILPFAQALAALVDGTWKAMRRSTWDEGIKVGVYHPSASMTQPYLFLMEGEFEKFPWTPDQSDLFAVDWEKVESAARHGGGLNSDDVLDLEHPPLPKVPKKKKAKGMGVKSHPANNPEWI